MKIAINEPCHENWEDMTPNEKGAFCLACQKTVVDFSKKTIEEIKTFFIQKPVTESVCGRFRQKQLHELSFDEFINEFMSWKFLKRAAVICFLVLGTTLFSSCSTTEEEKKEEIKKEKINYEDHTAGIVAFDTTFKSYPIDTVCAEPPKPNKDTLKTKKATKENKKQKEKPPVETHVKGDVAVN